MSDFNSTVEGNLDEEKLKIIKEAAVACQDKTGMERLDVFIEYGEKLSEHNKNTGKPLTNEEQKTLLAAVIATLPESEQKQVEQMMTMMGL